MIDFIRKVGTGLKCNNVIVHLLSLLCMVFSMTSCFENEFPYKPRIVPFQIVLNCDQKAANITAWNHLCDGENVFEQGLGDTYNIVHEYGKIRYIVRAYPLTDNLHTS